MKKYVTRALISLIFLISITGHSNQPTNQSGQLFSVKQAGTVINADIVLCLNGKGPLSCQNFSVSAQNLAISTTVNHQYPFAGIKILTPGIKATGCTEYNATGYCLFTANSNQTTTIQLSPNNANTYTVGGNVTGLTGTVTLLNNGADSTPISTDGQFVFASPVTEGGLCSNGRLSTQ